MNDALEKIELCAAIMNENNKNAGFVALLTIDAIYNIFMTRTINYDKAIKKSKILKSNESVDDSKKKNSKMYFNDKLNYFVNKNIVDHVTSQSIFKLHKKRSSLLHAGINNDRYLLTFSKVYYKYLTSLFIKTRYNYSFQYCKKNKYLNQYLIDFTFFNNHKKTKKIIIDEINRDYGFVYDENEIINTLKDYLYDIIKSLIVIVKHLINNEKFLRYENIIKSLSENYKLGKYEPYKPYLFKAIESLHRRIGKLNNKNILINFVDIDNDLEKISEPIIILSIELESHLSILAETQTGK